ncbi:MAG: hypothetical protein AAFR81_22070 [Chloroflexota bacterium]
MNIEETNTKHDKAMEFATLAFLAEQRGETDDASRLYREAYELEKLVADKLIPTDIEPSRSVILRSAASLAIDCGEYREAEKLIATALAGDPPKTIADQLRDLIVQVVAQLRQPVGD